MPVQEPEVRRSDRIRERKARKFANKGETSPKQQDHRSSVTVKPKTVKNSKIFDRSVYDPVSPQFRSMSAPICSESNHSKTYSVMDKNMDFENPLPVSSNNDMEAYYQDFSDNFSCENRNVFAQGIPQYENEARLEKQTVEQRTSRYTPNDMYDRHTRNQQRIADENSPVYNRLHDGVDSAHQNARNRFQIDSRNFPNDRMTENRHFQQNTSALYQQNQFVGNDFSNHQLPPRQLSASQPDQSSQRYYGYHNPYRMDYRLPQSTPYVEKERKLKVKPPSFNGSYNEWPYFKSLFLEAARMNDWTDQERKYYLMSNVHDEARTFVISLNHQMTGISFMDLLQAMEKRFGVGDRSHHFQSLLESLTWKVGENLRKYLDEVRRLVSLAYVEVPCNQQESLVKKHFINGLLEYQLKQKLLIDPPSSSESAMQYAERYVAANQAMQASSKLSQRERIRIVRSYEDSDGPESESEDEEIFELVNLLKAKGFISKKKNNKRWKDTKEIQCFHCKEKGHYKNKCPALNSTRSLPAGEGEINRKV